MTAVIVLVPLLALIVIALVVGVIVWAFTRPRRPVQPLAPPPGAAPSGWPSGRWNARVTKVGALTNLGARPGELTLRDGQVALTMEGSGQPEWQVSCQQLRVTPLSGFSMTGASLRLEGAFGGVNLVVSQEHINVLMDNDAKDMRERGYGRELVAMLAASGAQVVP
ncbi:MAG: hypothetical protein JWO46_3473 [Nocardioidaceae bacterium]|nr:hypothetical protein [Nocardioidaceae bacterium]